MSENSSTFAPAKYNGVPNAMPTQNSCPYNSVDCPCTKDCPRHGKCCECVKHHKDAGTNLPACLRGIDWLHHEEEKIAPIKQKPQRNPVSREMKTDLRVQKLIKVIGKQTLPRKQIIADLGLKQTSRQSFIDKYLKPAVHQGLISFAYPNTPNKPIQTYRLTANGMILYSQLTGDDWL